jgi:hypothetical protein
MIAFRLNYKHIIIKNKLSYVALLVLLASACNQRNASSVNGLRFSLLSSSATHIDFNNKVTESDSVNFFTNEYMYIGAGVAAGDFNNDGLQDLFFCGSQSPSKLYINKGNFKFEDVTQSAGINTNVWCLGVSVVDINNDGLQDIYICVSQSPHGDKRKNLLYINQGNLKFKEEAADYGLADTGYSTQAVFFDYDNDGDLDMYLLNHRLYNPYPNNLAPPDTSGNSPAEDRLYCNIGTPPGKNHPVYKDVSKTAGIKEDGYGLGVVVTDINNDGWQDIYVANDYIANDILWLNNRDGTFTNVIANATRHESYNSMGVDAADINNDALADIAVLDMSPEINSRKKTMFMSSGVEKYYMERRLNYQPSFTRNMLQLNNGFINEHGKQIPFFSEIGQLAGISETDWSWSVLLADFNNDGWKDMYVSNGIAKDLTNSDFVSYKKSSEEGGYSFNVSDITSQQERKQILKKLDDYGTVKQKNYLFLNDHNLRFTNATDSVEMNDLSVSQGCIYVDLDNDGDLDLVTNNMNQPASIWRNDLRKSAQDTVHNFITITLKGNKENSSGIGAKVFAYNKGAVQYFEQQTVRGYLSCMDNRIHIGIGNATAIDSLRVIWSDGKTQLLQHVKANQFITIKKTDALQNFNATTVNQSPLFTEVTAKESLLYKHNESVFFDFGKQTVLPQKYSQLGPCLAVADINGDGLQDFFVGGAAGQPGKIFMQKKDRTFTAHDIITGSKRGEDIGAVFFDANGDKHPDLLVTCGSSEFSENDSANAPCLYMNDGKGNFTLNKQALPNNINTMAAAVSVCDYDGDGDTDIFIGGRMIPGKYPASPRSYILQNNKGVFTDVTATVCPALLQPGMITAALWSDFDNDHQPDLIICGEWMPVRFFKNEKGKLHEVTANTGLADSTGLWRSLRAVDVDNDGDTDYIVGNIGMNNKFHIVAGRPMELYAKDIDNNGSVDLIPAYYIKDDEGKYELFPGIDRSQLADEAPVIKTKYLLYEDFAKVNMQQLVNDYGKNGWAVYTCNVEQSVWLENLGKGKFKMHDLPLPAQFAPVNTIAVKDVNNDGNIDLIIAGNEYQTDVVTGRYDASYGLILEGDGKGNFTPVKVAPSGFIINGDVKSLQLIRTSNKEDMVLAAVNDDSLRCFKLNYPHY